LISPQSPEVVELLRWGVLCFAGPAGREWQSQDRDSRSRLWPWVALLFALAMCQMTVGILYPEQTADNIIFAMM
jgi:hypothetical protein